MSDLDDLNHASVLLQRLKFNALTGSLLLGDTELGAGRINIRELLKAIPDIQNRPCYVEQESPKDELESMRADFEYLKRIEF